MSTEVAGNPGLTMSRMIFKNYLFKCSLAFNISKHIILLLNCAIFSTKRENNSYVIRKVMIIFKYKFQSKMFLSIFHIFHAYSDKFLILYPRKLSLFIKY
ncbi:unnamed protein product [Blepharisma stoltei]|uniref:Uncharacterized protein n=1 Tax=Blepharisma stoltei TaxID=1481888 RepID=A0AAU9JBD6_9CILI|nr:unnamed protein product [Blepharisma stoltei]